MNTSELFGRVGYVLRTAGWNLAQPGGWRGPFTFPASGRCVVEACVRVLGFDRLVVDEEQEKVRDVVLSVLRSTLGVDTWDELFAWNDYNGPEGPRRVGEVLSLVDRSEVTAGALFAAQQLFAWVFS